MQPAIPFSEPPKPSLSEADVIAYLVELKTAGHSIHQTAPRVFLLDFGGGAKVYFYASDINLVCRIEVHSFGHTVWSKLAENRVQLNDVVAQAARDLRQGWPFRPASGRLSALTPATNYLTISGLVRSAEVLSVFDPYLDNKALTVLLDILSFGGSLSDSVRLLSSTKATEGKVPRLTKTVVDHWFAQRGTTGQVRLMDPSEHRRFMLLSGGQSLILGPSLNSIHKNEAVRLEPDKEDREFFDGVWATAAPLT